LIQFRRRYIFIRKIKISYSIKYIMRKELLRILYVLPIISCVLMGCRGTTGENIPGKPNIVFIMADDLGYHDLGCYGQDRILTPNIDRLAGEGLMFTDFYAGAAVCAPARAVLQTGLHTGHVTVRGNQCRSGGLQQPPGSTGRPASMRIGIPESEPTIATFLGKAGYYTGLFGKWHLSGYLYDNLPVRRGYHEFSGTSLANRGGSMPGHMVNYDSVTTIPDEFTADSKDETWTLLAIDFMKRNREKPFFLMLNLSTPHKPFNINSQGIYADSSWNEMSKNYAALVSRLDVHVGMVLDALKELGLEENTILVFCSDNGGEYRESPEDWAEWTMTFRNNWPLRGGKADFYEGGIRIPFIARWPGVIEPGRENSQPAYFADMLPTFSDLAGAPLPDTCDGISLLDILTGEKEMLDERFLYWEFDHRGFHQAVRWGDWVMLRYLQRQQRIYGQEGPDDRRRSERYPFFELYNLAEDLSQENNVIEDYPEVANEMLDYLRSARWDNPYYPLTQAEQASLDTSNMTVFR
jgi:arylsulfatase A-like enzyme